MPVIPRRVWTVSVGIDHYHDPRIGSLRFAAADAQEFHNVLLTSFDPAILDATLLTDDQATLRKVRAEIGERLAHVVNDQDLVLIFFAGHGSPETSPKVDGTSRYLVMHDTSYDSIFATGLDLERDFLRLLERIPARHIVVFLDACFSGRAGGRTFEGPALEQMRGTTRAPIGSLEKLDLGEGRMIVSACDDWQVARESQELGHGIFTFCLLKILTQVRRNEPTISVTRLYDEVASEVARRTTGSQHPILNGRARVLRLPLFTRGAETHKRDRLGTKGEIDKQ